MTGTHSARQVNALNEAMLSYPRRTIRPSWDEEICNLCSKWDNN